MVAGPVIGSDITNVMIGTKIWQLDLTGSLFRYSSTVSVDPQKISAVNCFPSGAVHRVRTCSPASGAKLRMADGPAAASSRSKFERLLTRAPFR